MAHEEADDEPPRRRRPPDDDDDEMRPLRRPQPKSKLPLILGIVGSVLLLCCGSGVFGIYYATRKAGEKVQEAFDKAKDEIADSDARTNMQMIAIGFNNQDNAHGHLLSNTYKNGQPYLSWRVHLLPYINQETLYRQFKLDEPWDSANNKPLLNRMPTNFSTVAYRKKHGDTMTPFRAMTSPRGALGHKLPKHDMQLHPDGPRLAAEGFPDGVSRTIMIFESDEFVEWTKPDEVEWNDAMAPKPSAIPGVVAGKLAHFNAVMSEGTPLKIKRNLDHQILWRLFTRDDGLALPAGWQD